MTNHQSLYEVMAETSRRADESAGYLPREQASDEAADRANVPAAAEETQLMFWDLILAVGIAVLAACAFAAIIFR